MPVYHSAQNQINCQIACGAGILPLHTQLKGPAPPCKTADIDIVDEALTFFRANVLFRKFPMQGPADLTLAYLTVLIGEALRIFVKCKDKNEAKSKATAISLSQTFAIPGESKFCLPGFFQPPKDRNEAELFRSYYRQLREECINRLIELCFAQNGQPNKWWLSFSRRKFMNVAST